MGEVIRQGATADARLAMSAEHAQAITHIAAIVRSLADLPSESRALQVRIVKDLLWVVTEYKPGPNHKLRGVRWRTPDAHRLVTLREFRVLRHEHVVERGPLASRLLDLSDHAETILWNCPACIVTNDEHQRLTASRAWGWQRYIESGIPVIDARTGDVAALTEMQAALDAVYRGVGYFAQ